MWRRLCLSFPSRQFRLQLPDPGLGRQPAFLGLCLGLLGCESSFPLPLEGGNFLTRLRVVPPELTVLPPDQQAQHGAVALQDAFLELFDGDGLVPPFRQPVPGQLGPVEVAGVVEAPVLGDAQGGVLGRLGQDVDFAPGRKT